MRQFKQIGFTGSRVGMSELQYSLVRNRLTYLYNNLGAKEFHQGCCIGSDHQATILAKGIGYWIAAHPPIDQSMAFDFVTECDEVWGSKDYLVRDEEIVLASDLLVATPNTTHPVTRSGTWITIGYADREEIPTLIIYPNGFMELRNY